MWKNSGVGLLQKIRDRGSNPKSVSEDDAQAPGSQATASEKPIEGVGTQPGSFVGDAPPDPTPPDGDDGDDGFWSRWSGFWSRWLQ